MLKRLVFVTSVGAIMEFYDFSMVLLFADYLAHVFLPGHNEKNTLWIFAIFALGYFIRPLGGILFSHFGDRIGRKRLFQVSIISMTAATLAIGLLPGYQSIGLAAPVCLIICRIVQGLAVGGELPGATIFAAEHVPVERRGAITGIISASATLGMVLAATTGSIATAFLSDQQLYSWGWRIPFILASGMGVIGFIIRRNLNETPVFMELIKQGNAVKVPLFTALKHYPKEILFAAGLTAISGIVLSIYMFIPSYATRHLGMPADEAYLLSSTVLVLDVILAIGFGWLSDKIGRRKLMRFGSILLILLATPFHFLLSRGEIWLAILITFIPLAIQEGCLLAAESELFSTEIRYTGFAIGYNIGTSIFAGTTPFFLEKYSSLGIYNILLFALIIAATIGFITHWLMPCRYRQSLNTSKPKLIVD